MRCSPVFTRNDVHTEVALSKISIHPSASILQIFCSFISFWAPWTDAYLQFNGCLTLQFCVWIGCIVIGIKLRANFFISVQRLTDRFTFFFFCRNFPTWFRFGTGWEIDNRNQLWLKMFILFYSFIAEKVQNATT